MKVMFCVSWIGWVLLCYCFDDLFDGILAECWLCLVKLFVLCVLVDIVVQLCGVWLCLVLQDLGLIFVKFGQILFICCDLILVDVVNELILLQDWVKFFDGDIVQCIVEVVFGCLVSEVFVSFDLQLLVLVLIVQVYVVMLVDGCQVVVKVLCLDIEKQIDVDIVLLKLVVVLVECIYLCVDRICLCEVVVEVENILVVELDLQCEGVNVSVLCCNWIDLDDLYVFEVIWSYIVECVLILECVWGILFDDIVVLDKVGIDCRVLVVKGVWVFYIQVFCDNFFYVDVYVGNIWVDLDLVCCDNLCFIVLDFGIMGQFLQEDQYYLVENFMVIFNKDYWCMVEFYVEVGWMFNNVCIDELEVVVCLVCELYFICLLLQILLVEVLMKLFCVVQCYQFILQLQLILLQKILFNIEGVGCQFDLQLDIWVVV